MPTMRLVKRVYQPTIEEMNSAYPRMPCNTDQKKSIYKILTDTSNIYTVLILAEETDYSPIFYYEKQLCKAIDQGDIKPLSYADKQFVGAAIKLIMSLNNWKPTGIKQRFKNKLFSTGERFQKIK